MAFAAVTDKVEPLGWALFAANFFWIIAYDTEYAMADYPDDIRIGIHTSAIAFGRHVVTAVVICYALALAILAGIGIWAGYGVLYFAGLLAATVIAAYHRELIRDRDRNKCFRAFRHNNWFGFAVFAGIVADYAGRLHQWPRHW
jgi:4-hydroxybenzoate polyprenyltransferase